MLASVMGRVEADKNDDVAVALADVVAVVKLASTFRRPSGN
jgi:hypothetical protein